MFPLRVARDTVHTCVRGGTAARREISKRLWPKSRKFLFRVLLLKTMTRSTCRWRVQMNDEKTTSGKSPKSNAARCRTALSNVSSDCRARLQENIAVPKDPPTRTGFAELKTFHEKSAQSNDFRRSKSGKDQRRRPPCWQPEWARFPRRWRAVQDPVRRSAYPLTTCSFAFQRRNVENIFILTSCVPFFPYKKPCSRVSPPGRVGTVTTIRRSYRTDLSPSSCGREKRECHNARARRSLSPNSGL